MNVATENAREKLREVFTGGSGQYQFKPLEAWGLDLQCSMSLNTATTDTNQAQQDADTQAERDHRTLFSVRLVSKQPFADVNDYHEWASFCDTMNFVEDFGMARKFLLCGILGAGSRRTWSKKKRVRDAGF